MSKWHLPRRIGMRGRKIRTAGWSLSQKHPLFTGAFYSTSRSTMLTTSLIFSVLLGSALAKPYQLPTPAFFSRADPVSLFKRIDSGCSGSGPVSCSTSVSDTCCTESPGGLLLQTQVTGFKGTRYLWTCYSQIFFYIMQFWDTNVRCSSPGVPTSWFPFPLAFYWAKR